ncbi:MAG: hypothetical protein JWR59_735 [Brevundimonas sp.]|nr:hypothetical protein [Brevundimonas sp.]
MEEILRLRGQAARARQLANVTTDLMTIESLHHYAYDCERQADFLRARIEDANRSRRSLS